MAGLTPGAVKRLWWAHEAYQDATSRMRKHHRIELTEFVFYVPARSGQLPSDWAALVAEGLADAKGLGTPTHAFFITISDEGERVIQEIVHGH